jgi:hypothetical protein
MIGTILALVLAQAPVIAPAEEAPPLPPEAVVVQAQPVQPPVVVIENNTYFVYYAGVWYPWMTWCGWYGVSCAYIPQAGYFYAYPRVGVVFPSPWIWRGGYRPVYPAYRYGGPVYYHGGGYHGPVVVRPVAPVRVYHAPVHVVAPPHHR